jgi:hypothetical protein
MDHVPICRGNDGHAGNAEIFLNDIDSGRGTAAAGRCSRGSAGALTGKFHNRYHILLKEMEADGILYRKEYPQVPPKVEYGLTELGKSLMPILHDVCTWGQDHYVQR